MASSAQGRPAGTARGYQRSVYEQLVQLELLLPLTREDELREVLDELFYEEALANMV